MRTQKQILTGTLAVVLGGGVLFSWSQVFAQYLDFLGVYPSIFFFGQTIVPNPLLTPCLYGSVALLVSFVWALTLWISFHERSMRLLSYLLLFGVCFALLVLGYEALEYYHLVQFSVSISCSPGVHPLMTPCAGGFLFFLASWLLSKAIRVHPW